MSLTVVTHEPPKIKIPNIICDRPLHSKLEQIPILQLMNKSFCCAVLGRPGSGKSSLVVGMLATPTMLKKVFHTICLFMPPNSRKSIKDSIFDTLPEEQVFDTLNLANLQKAWDFAQKNAQEKKPKNTLFIFDDVQQFFKGDAADLLLNIQSNRRHNYLSIIYICQSYKKLPRTNRLGLSDLFGYNLSKDDLEDVFTELVDKPRQSWEIFNRYYRTLIEHQSRGITPENMAPGATKKSDDERIFMYFNVETNRHFINWNEVLVEDPKEKEQWSVEPTGSKKRPREEEEKEPEKEETKQPKKEHPKKHPLLQEPLKKNRSTRSRPMLLV